MAEFGLDATAAIHEFEKIIGKGEEKNVLVSVKPEVLQLCLDSLNESEMASPSMVGTENGRTMSDHVKKLSWMLDGTRTGSFIRIPLSGDEVQFIGWNVVEKCAYNYSRDGQKLQDEDKDLAGTAFIWLYHAFRNSGGDQLLDLEKSLVKIGLL